MLSPPPRTPFFPYTTLFRSRRGRAAGAGRRAGRRVRRAVRRAGDRLQAPRRPERLGGLRRDRKSTRLNSSHLVISYAVFCLKKKKKKDQMTQLADTTINIPE